MPTLNKSRVKHRLALKDITSTERLAEELEMPWGSLRNALAGRDPLNLNRIYKLGRKLALDGEDAVEVAADIVALPEVAAEMRANANNVQAVA